MPLQCIRRNCRQDGEFVDQLGRQGSGDLEGAEWVRSGSDLRLPGSCPSKLAILFFNVEQADLRAESRNDVEQRRTRRIQADGVEDEIGILERAARGKGRMRQKLRSPGTVTSTGF